MELNVYDKENKILKPFFTQRRPSKKTCSTNSGEIKAIPQSLIKKIIKKRSTVDNVEERSTNSHS